MSFVSQGKGAVFVLQGLWLGAAFWLLKFCISQDASQDQAGTSANLGWFESAKYLLQLDTKNQDW